MTSSWSELGREPAIDTKKKLDRVREKMPRLRVDVAFTNARIRLTLGKTIVTLDLDRDVSSEGPGARSGVGKITPPDAKAADAIVAAVARVAEADVPVRPYEPGLRAPIVVPMQGVHAAAGKSSLLWLTFEVGEACESEIVHRWHLLVPPGKDRGYLHFELPRGGASRAELLQTFARALRDGRAPRSTPATDLRCSSTAPWLETTPLVVPDDIDLAHARWEGSALFATRSDGEATVILRCDGPSGFVEIGRVNAPDIAIYPSPTGAHVLLEGRGLSPLGRVKDAQVSRELLDVTTGLRTRLVEAYELFAFGDASGGAMWSADGARLAMGGKVTLAGERAGVLVYDVPLGIFVDATPIDGTFFLSHWEGATLCLRGGPLNGRIAFRWEAGRADPRADVVLGHVSPGGRFALLTQDDRTRVLDRTAGSFTGSLPAADGRFAYDDAWVTDEDDPRVFDLSKDTYRYLAPPGPVLGLRVAKTAPCAVFNDGTRWLWGSPAEIATAAQSSTPAGTQVGARVLPTLDHPMPTIVRRALAERRAGRIEEASLLVAEDARGGARRAISELETRLRAEVALEAGNAQIARDVEGALTHFEAAVQGAPDLYDALQKCELALGKLGRSDEQREVAGFLCARFPTSSAAWLVRSVALQNARDLPGALNAIERALALDREGMDLGQRRAKTTDLLRQRASVHLLEGRKQDAIDDLRALLEAEPAARGQLAADPGLAALRRHPLLRG